jgi:type I restriction enzyme S subunit
MDQPSHWAYARLDEVCLLITDGTHHSPPNTEKGDYMYVTAKNIKTWGLDVQDITFVSSEHHEEIYSRCPASKGDVLYIKDGVTAGLAAVNHLGNPFSMLSSVALIRPNEEILNSEFLKYWLNSPETFSKMTGGMTGSAIRRIILKQIRAAELSLPPIKEQRRIAAKLDTTLAAVEACRQRLDGVAMILKRFRQAVLAAATSGELTREWREEAGAIFDWPKVILGDHAEGFSYGTSAKSHNEGEIPVLRMGNIQNGGLDWKSLAFTSDLAEIAKYMLDPGDVLFNRTNSPELVGKTAIYRGEQPAIYAGYLIRVRCRASLDPEFLNISLNSLAAREYCWRVKSDGVSQSNINAKKLAAYSFMLPLIDEQVEIVRRTHELFTYADQLEAKLTAARKLVERLTPALLAKAFRGELAPQDPSDQPASEPARPRPLRANPRGASGDRLQPTRINSLWMPPPSRLIC